MGCIFTGRPCFLVITIEEHSYAHYNQQDNEVLDGRVVLTTQQYSKEQYRNRLGRLPQNLQEMAH